MPARCAIVACLACAASGAGRARTFGARQTGSSGGIRGPRHDWPTASTHAHVAGAPRTSARECGPMGAPVHADGTNARCGPSGQRTDRPRDPCRRPAGPSSPRHTGARSAGFERFLPVRRSSGRRADPEAVIHAIFTEKVEPLRPNTTRPASQSEPTALGTSAGFSAERLEERWTTGNLTGPTTTGWRS